MLPVARPAPLPAQSAAPPQETDDPRADIGRLLITCPDRPGIVAGVSRCLYEHGANIVESQQYSTNPLGGTFFLLVAFHLPGLARRMAQLEQSLAGLASAFAMTWRMTRAADRKRMAIFVSRSDHALRELLWRNQSGELNADITMVISNHQTTGELVRSWGIPFHYVPVTPDTRATAEQAQLRLLDGQADLVVLARYMQILSPAFLGAIRHPIINIHHSFLPAFVGGNPHQQAADRGVKLIGATAHYVTADLDAGPIIEQDTVRVDHRCSVDDLRRLGRHVERSVLARAVAWHLDDRVIVHQNKTIVFA
ncbi:MAG TPA: formyltetrahydrofolate deformylase [Streptosporangiaceae bacterium]|nr:formyltetrahydrofolate deformylase [Streptosporangiaceae bacterium]